MLLFLENEIIRKNIHLFKFVYIHCIHIERNIINQFILTEYTHMIIIIKYNIYDTQDI